MNREEAIECNKNLRMYMELSDKNHPYKFLEENYIALDMAIKALQQEHCEDAISRQELLEKIYDVDGMEALENSNIFAKHYADVVKAMPSVTPKPKLGKWIDEGWYADGHGEHAYRCSKCDEHYIGYVGEYKYCPNCGCRMVEPQETETWDGIHAQITAPKGTFDRLFNEADDDDDI